MREDYASYFEEKQRGRDERALQKLSVECPVCGAPPHSLCYGKEQQGYGNWVFTPDKSVQKPHRERVNIARPDLAERCLQLKRASRKTKEEPEDKYIEWRIQHLGGQWPLWAREVKCPACNKRKHHACVSRHAPHPIMEKAHIERIRLAAKEEWDACMKNRKSYVASVARDARDYAARMRYVVDLEEAQSVALKKVDLTAEYIAKKHYTDRFSKTEEEVAEYIAKKHYTDRFSSWPWGDDTSE